VKRESPSIATISKSFKCHGNVNGTCNVDRKVEANLKADQQLPAAWASSGDSELCVRNVCRMETIGADNSGSSGAHQSIK
jgi:hypothetical protein